MMKFSKVLVANRGEIAVRVMQTAKAMGYQTVAVYSDADANARHVQVADEAVYIGASKVSESYLSITNIIEACKKTGADAALARHGDGHAMLGDGVHRGRRQRDVEADPTRELRGRVRLGGDDVGLVRLQQHVVVREAHGGERGGHPGSGQLFLHRGTSHSGSGVRGRV